MPVRALFAASEHACSFETLPMVKGITLFAVVTWISEMLSASITRLDFWHLDFLFLQTTPYGGQAPSSSVLICRTDM